MKHLIKLIGLLAFGTAACMIAATSNAAGALVVINAAKPAEPVKGKEVVVKGKKPVEKKAAAPKKNDGKVKPLDPNRKKPTLKKKYRKED